MSRDLSTKRDVWRKYLSGTRIVPRLLGAMSLSIHLIIAH